jgi:2-(1,2-epoxy-1,2-dihydrophenyl)acetyl-CoA isomerase
MRRKGAVMSKENPSVGDAAPVLQETHGAVAVIRLNRPDRLNAVDDEMIRAIRTAIRAVREDAAIRSAVLIGNGRCFMAGADLSVFHSELADASRTAARLIDGFHAMLREIRAMPKPVIAAIAGNVAGGGVGLALACDLAVMADDARLISGYSKLGTSPDAGTTWSLTRAVGARRAFELMCLNTPVSAQEALALGLVNRIVPASQLAGQAAEMAQRLAEGAPMAVANIKSLVETAGDFDFSSQLDKERASFIECAATDQFREGINAFFERRSPRF